MDYLLDLLECLERGMSVDYLAYVVDSDGDSVTIEHDDGSEETVTITFKNGRYSAK